MGVACRETHVAPRRLCRWPETPPSTPDESGATSPSEEGEGYSLRFETVSQRSPEAGEGHPFRLQAVSQRKFKGEGAGAPCLPRIPPCLATPDGAQRRSGVQGRQATPFRSALRLRSGQALGPGSSPGRQKCWGFERSDRGGNRVGISGDWIGAAAGLSPRHPSPRDMLGKAARVHAAIPPPLQKGRSGGGGALPNPSRKGGRLIEGRHLAGNGETDGS